MSTMAVSLDFGGSFEEDVVSVMFVHSTNVPACLDG